jgi:hypothetical protein
MTSFADGQCSGLWGGRRQVQEHARIINQDEMLNCPGIDNCNLFEHRTFFVLAGGDAAGPVGVKPYQGGPGQFRHQGFQDVLAIAQPKIDVRTRRHALSRCPVKLRVSLD